MFHATFFATAVPPKKPALCRAGEGFSEARRDKSPFGRNGSEARCDKSPLGVITIGMEFTVLMEKKRTSFSFRAKKTE